MSAEATGRRVEEALDRLAESGDRAAADAAEELVRALTAFYGAGLARIVDLLSGRPGDPLAALLGDEVAAGLLVLHDLHPEQTAARIARALEAARADSVEVADFDEATGTLRLAARDQGGCGCPSTTEATRQRIEAALSCFAPEVASVELRQPGAAEREPVLLQIGARPVAAS
ncbi:NifU family protein [Peterkaempfera bronchialis]|uniref:NifU family protein n=1 Tax=Peterkaempfera bronchialis TaxID=2126346 RepID=A0A345SU42_9ACTN|nr:NifU family protein [Peterkaempfera bronchialis]AXI77247.1 NifU family protein [Peterkaempfera bronchialis]